MSQQPEPTVQRRYHTIGWDAYDQKAGLTFGELRKLVQETMREDMDDDAKVRADVDWFGRIRQLRIEEVPR